ncbi:MAG: sulfatase-like hydrolase/transferase [Planctomycetes bacterium]|nr:sulfatase-like hydrolase/transferase [Planctomycetota bacterium]
MVFCFVMLFVAIAAAVGRAGPPNVVVILADDQGWGDLSVNGNTNLSTPNIDALAAAGTIMDRFYVCAVCSPTRAEFLTGRYHVRMGVHSTSTGGERMNPDEKTIADTFKAAGYATGAFGKWHNGSQWPYHPNARGFDEYYGFTSGHWGSYFDPMLEHNGVITQGKGFIIDDLADHAMAFIEAHKDQPFFCYIPFNTPHFPPQVPDRFYDKFREAPIKMRSDLNGAGKATEPLEETRAVLAMVENVDWNVGRIVAKLDELKLADNTIVIYFSDNGPNSWRWNDGMKGRKGSVDEGGVRSPFMIRWPGHIAAGAHRPQIAAAIDLLPTLADLAGIPIVSTKPLDGKSIKPLLVGEAPADWPDRAIFSHWNNKVSVRTQQYRFDQNERLFDMSADPGQHAPIKDMTPAQRGLAKQLGKDVVDFREAFSPLLAHDDRPFTVGFGGLDFPVTLLPARDGEPHGCVERSNHYPNCTFFTHWTDLTGSITWDAQVGEAGKYEVVIYYACPAADVGSTIELSFEGVKLTGKVSAAHDPPLYGWEHDRFKRGEGYVKDFKPMTLGTIELPKARDQLTLRATQMPGKQVMEVRLLQLTRVK